MGDEMRFARISTSLRAPRLAVLVATDRWQQQSRMALQALSGIWGGAGGVVIPVDTNGDVHPLVFRALEQFDPDYIAPLYFNAQQFEAMYPGVLPLSYNNRRLRAASTRKRFLDKFGANLHAGQSIPDDHIKTLSDRLNTFKDDGERVHAVSTWSGPGNPLSGVPTGATVRSFYGTTGDPLLDLAVLCRTGETDEDDDSADLATLRQSTLWEPVFADLGDQRTTPFAATTQHLVSVYRGFQRRHGHLVVIGDTADDFAFALLLSRFQQNVSWMPALVGAPRHVRSEAGTRLSLIRDEPIIGTSLSLTKTQVGQRLGRLWGARHLRLIPPGKLNWQYEAPSALSLEPHHTYAVRDSWDLRISQPVKEQEDGASEMLAPPLVEWPADLEALDLRWIVQHDRLDRRLPHAPALRQPMLVAPDQNPDETFIRASRGGIAYERGRWDFVAAGASRAGRAAAPVLRWPSVQEMLAAAAASHGMSIRLSDAGRRARIAARLWGSIGSLVEDLRGESLKVLNAFIPNTRSNGTYAVGAGKGIVRYGTGYVTFDVLQDLCAPAWSPEQLRAWLDGLLARGVFRRGLLLGCQTCSALEFYAIGGLSQRNDCPRCGSVNELTQERWRDPHSEPAWYYTLHQAVADLLSSNGHLPLLAWEALAAAIREPSGSWFEIELVGADGKAIVEFDIVGVRGTEVVLGEAKLGNSLDGKNAAAKERDARKMLDGAATLGAHVLCLATTKSWDAATTTALHAARGDDSPTIVMIQKLTTASKSTLSVFV